MEAAGHVSVLAIGGDLDVTGVAQGPTVPAGATAAIEGSVPSTRRAGVRQAKLGEHTGRRSATERADAVEGVAARPLNRVDVLAVR